MMAAETTTAKAEKIGARHGEAYAREIARKAASGPFDRRRVVPDMQAHLEHQARIYGAAGWTPVDGVAWAKAFVAAAEPILVPLVAGRAVMLPAVGLDAMAEKICDLSAPRADSSTDAAATDQSNVRSETVKIGWPDEETRARVLRMIEEGPLLRRAFESGIHGAVTATIPSIYGGAFGSEPVKIMFIAERIADVAAKHWMRDFGPEYAYLSRQGFLCACLSAANEYGRRCQEGGGPPVDNQWRPPHVTRPRHMIDFGPLPVRFPVVA